MRLFRCAAAAGLVLIMAVGCRSSSSPTTKLDEVPKAGSPGASSWSTSSSLKSLPDGPRRIFGLEPPEMFFGEQEELPLPSRRMLPAQGVQKTIDRVVGRVNKDIITLSEIQELAQPVITGLPSALPPERRDEEVRKIQNKVLGMIIDHRLQTQHAERLGVSVSDRELDEAVADVMVKNNLTPEQFEVLLAREGLTMEQYREKIQEQIVRRRVYNFEVISRVQITDADIRDFYRENPKDFIPPKSVLLSQIFITLPTNGDEPTRLAAHNKADLVLSALRRGEPFAEVARAQSEDPTSNRGGRLGRFKKGDMMPALESAAFDMSEGEIRGPIPTDSGLHFIKVDRKWGDEPLPLERVGESIKRHLLAKRQNERYLEWMEILRSDAFIERADLRKAPGGGG
jgi:peptidyl-prolyl cis-trans isomerase SurA